MVSRNNSLSNFDMMNILNNQGVEFNGIFMKNELPEKLKRGAYIVNLQSSKEGNGTHWVAFYYTPSGSYYYDSYGFVPPLEVEAKIRPYVYSDNQIQDLDSTACGYYCLAFVMFLHNKNNIERAYHTFINLFKKDTEINDRILYKILYH